MLAIEIRVHLLYTRCTIIEKMKTQSAVSKIIAKVGIPMDRAEIVRRHYSTGPATREKRYDGDDGQGCTRRKPANMSQYVNISLS